MLTQKVPIHDVLFVICTIVTTAVKGPRFHFPKKGYSFVYATVQFDMFFSLSQHGKRIP